MRVLFSPVGTTDPIKKHRDGSMLHICRYYQPDKVYLYLSKEMQEYEKKDHRFTYCLHQLEKQQCRHIEINLIERENLENVQDFNTFYLEFRPIIEQILREEIGEADELLLNTSSGTPAMKSGLLVLQTIEHYEHCQLVQVSTPVKRSNNGIDQYNPEEAWATCADNDIEENRCVDIDCPALEEIQREDIIKKHIDAYDYDAALTVAAGVQEKSKRRRFKSYIEIGKDRLDLNLKNVTNKCNTLHETVFDMPEGRERDLVEYTLGLKVRMQRNQYADFIRGITPILVNLFEEIIRDRYHLDINDYCEKKGFWSQQLLEGTEILDILNEVYHPFRIDGTTMVSSDHLRAIIQRKEEGKGELNNMVNSLRQTEMEIRNKAAHEITAVSQNIKMYKVFGKICKLYNYTHFPEAYEWWTSGIQWDSYDRMNTMIKKHIR